VPVRRVALSSSSYSRGPISGLRPTPDSTKTDAGHGARRKAGLAVRPSNKADDAERRESGSSARPSCDRVRHRLVQSDVTAVDFSSDCEHLCVCCV
jgi:hypothetical protein